MLSEQPKLRVIIVSAYLNPKYVLEALTIGAYGYVCKSESTATIGTAIQIVSQGDRVFSPEVAHIATCLGHPVPGKSSRPADILSHREREVALLMTEGVGCRECAKKLEIHESTIRVFWRRALKKMGLKKIQQRFVPDP